jgi:hypothetical protein
MRNFAPCNACVFLGDESDKILHGRGLCEKHYKADQRRRQADTEHGEVAVDNHRSRELKAHQFIASKFQKFLFDLNHENVGVVLPVELVQEIRLLLSPLMTVSVRMAVPKSLPVEMLHVDTGILGDEGTQDDSQGDLSPQDEKIAKAYQDEILETTRASREQRRELAFEIINAGCEKLRKKYPDPKDFASLMSVTKLLLFLAGSDVIDDEQ